MVNASPPKGFTFRRRGVEREEGKTGCVDRAYVIQNSSTPRGMKILYTSTKDGREQEIFMLDLNNPRSWPRLSFSQDQYFWNQYPTWSPDSKQIAFSSDRGHIGSFTEIWVMNVGGSGAKKLGDGSRDAWAPVWIKWSK